MVQKFKSIHIDLEKKEFLVNGEKMNPFTRKIELEFENGEWTLVVTGDQRYSSAVKE